MGCLFCATGRQGFQDQLSAGQIVNQLRSLPESAIVSNIVFMGMGEPLDNLVEVMKAQEIITAPYGFNLSIRKVTVSTIGIIPAMEIFLRESKCNLALSLHSPFDDERRRLMPIQNVYPVKDVIEAINRSEIGKYRRLSVEYIVFGGMNDTPKHVKELARLLNKTRCRINLIRFHQVPDVPLPPTDEAGMIAFQKALNKKGIVTTIRASRGQDIDAACGLLSTKALVQKIETDY
jgi:23S rRNA (adenine2503-C2)-methyltransferase